MDIGQTEFTSLVSECQSLVIQSEQVQYGGVEIVNLDSVLGHIHSKIVRLSVTDTAFDSAASYV